MASGAQIKYPGAVFGYAVDQPQGASGDVEFFLSNAALTQGQAVILGADAAHVGPAATNSAGTLVIGFVSEAAAAAEESVPIVYQGRAIAVVATTVTAGNLLGLSATNAGFLAPVTAGVAITQYGDAGKVLAVAESTVTTNTTTQTVVRILRL